MWRWIALLSIIAMGATGWWGWSAEQQHKAALDRVTRLEAELAKRGVVLPYTGEPIAEKPAAAAPKPAVAIRDGVDVSKYLKMIDDLRARTAELEKEGQEARVDEERVREQLAARVEEVKKLSQQLASIEEDAQRQRRVSEALETELKFKAQRLTQSETSEKLLQEKLSKAEAAAKKALVVAKDAEDLQRRREAALVGLERRYREVTDLYRSFSLNLQTRENPGQGLQAGDLSRIQTALQQAEEELRQLRSLNARVAELSRPK